ncbi:potassium channel family protein [Streptomyces sp. NPDC054838]
MKHAPELGNLPKRRRRLLVLRAVLRPVLTAAGLVVAYYALPLDQPFSTETVVALVIGLLAVSALVVWQTRAITRSPYPRLKAVEALATVFPLFLLLFAATYFLMERSQPGYFTEPLTRTDALYFTVTVFSTVGFGDIAPKAQGARCVAMAQMLGDLILVGAAVRVIVGAVDVGLRSRPPSASPGPRPVRLPHRTNRTNHSTRSPSRRK